MLSREIFFAGNLVAWLGEYDCHPLRYLTVLSRSTRNERHLRLDAADEPSSTPNTTLTPCPVCRLTFFCSETHLEAVIAIHKDHPHPDSPEGLSACAMNRQIYEDVLLRSAIVASGDEQESVVWAPERTLSSWISVVAPPRTWTEEYGEQLKRSMGLPDRIPMPPWVRSASRPLSMPMTILWGLEKLNEDDAWTRKSTLNIHVCIFSNLNSPAHRSCSDHWCISRRNQRGDGHGRDSSSVVCRSDIASACYMTLSVSWITEYGHHNLDLLLWPTARSTDQLLFTLRSNDGDGNGNMSVCHPPSSSLPLF